MDRPGPARVLFAGHVFWPLLPLFWLLATPETALVFLGAGSIAGGVGVILAGSLLQIMTNNASPEFLARSGDGFRVLFLASLARRC